MFVRKNIFLALSDAPKSSCKKVLRTSKILRNKFCILNNSNQPIWLFGTDTNISAIHGPIADTDN